jgi:hypothetical protein
MLFVAYLFQSSQVFSCFGKLAFFHALTDIPMDECSLGVPEENCGNDPKL